MKEKKKSERTESVIQQSLMPPVGLLALPEPPGIIVKSQSQNPLLEATSKVVSTAQSQTNRVTMNQNKNSK